MADGPGACTSKPGELYRARSCQSISDRSNHGAASAPAAGRISVPYRPAATPPGGPDAMLAGAGTRWMGGGHMDDHQRSAIECTRIAWHDHQFEHGCYGRDCAEDRT